MAKLPPGARAAIVSAIRSADADPDEVLDILAEFQAAKAETGGQMRTVHTMLAETLRDWAEALREEG